jgi:Ca2+-binding EF-hand superfamily protein
VFKAINSTVGGILSLGELLDMAGKLEMFLTEEEGSRIFALMDIDSDEKVSRTCFVCVFVYRVISLSYFLVLQASSDFRS